MGKPFPPGYENNVFIFGRAQSLRINEECLVWNEGSDYKGILANESALTIVSDSDLDKVGGGGATKVVFFYQGEDGLEKNVIVELNGLTPVNVPDVLADVSYSAWVVESENTTDFDGGNIGCIICYQTGTATNILWEIPAGEAKSLMAFYRVPSNKYLELLEFNAFPVGLKPVEMRFRGKPEKNVPWRVHAIGDADSTPIPVGLVNAPRVVRPGSYIVITAKAKLADTKVSAHMVGQLKDYPGSDFYGGDILF